MTDITSLGYPEGYHLGISFILWSIFIVVIAILGIKLYLNAKKSDLINVKEMLRAKSFLYFGYSIFFFLIQVGVFAPDYFIQFYLLGGFIITTLTAFYYYTWEKNLTTIKRIPSLSIVVAAIVALIGLLIATFVPDLIDFILNFLVFIVLSLTTISLALYVYLIFIFSRNVKGVSTAVSWIWIAGTILLLVALFFENPPGVKIFPASIVNHFPPIGLLIGLIMAFYGINKMFAQISSYYAQTQKCVVHRGTIEKGNPMYCCPSCGIVYCIPCFNKVIKKDGCWNCGLGTTTESEKEWIKEHDLELKEADVLKKKPIPKGKQ